MGVGAPAAAAAVAAAAAIAAAAEGEEGEGEGEGGGEREGGGEGGGEQQHRPQQQQQQQRRKGREGKRDKEKEKPPPPAVPLSCTPAVPPSRPPVVPPSRCHASLPRRSVPFPVAACRRLRRVASRRLVPRSPPAYGLRPGETASRRGHLFCGRRGSRRTRRGCRGSRAAADHAAASRPKRDPLLSIRVWPRWAAPAGAIIGEGREPLFPGAVGPEGRKRLAWKPPRNQGQGAIPSLRLLAHDTYYMY